MALGIVLTPYGKIPGQWPWEIARSGPDNAPQLLPFDPQYNTRATPGLYFDTPLGGRGGLGIAAGPAARVAPIAPQKVGPQLLGSNATLGALPTDAELAKDRCYTPVASGWIRTNNGYMAPPWVPGIGPGPGLGGLFGLGADNVVPSEPSSTPIQPTPPLPVNFDPVAAEERHRQRMFFLQVVSVTAVVAVSVINFYRAAKDMGKK